MKLMTKSFKGANVFLSRSLVPPEMFDAVHDSLKQNGAEVFLCRDTSRSGVDDYHVISSFDHDKFEELITKGCNLLGPQCVLFCAKENRAFPKQKGFTCCLAMEGVKVLASGFKEDEKIRIEKLVTAMGGVFQTRTSQDISFVIVNNVLAGKYKWALNCLKKPIVTIDWLYKCWTEHRIVPQEPYRILPFSGLIICITRIPVDVRKEMEKIVVKNGGQYSGNLTRACTHLISDAPLGDKYVVARKWGHIHIVTKKWFDQSVARKACLGEESYLVQGGSVASSSSLKHGLKGTHNQDKGNIRNSQSVPSPRKELEPTLSQNISSAVSESTLASKHEETEASTFMPGEETKFDSNIVADDSQNDDNDLYLSDCRILLVGFHVTEMRKLVNMVRKGGGSRYMSFSEKLTHIIIGTPSESERKEIRRFAASGIIHMVRTVWLHDCDREKKEVTVSQRHIVSELFPRQDPVCFTKTPVKGVPGMNQGKSSIVTSSMPADEVVMSETTYQTGIPSEKTGEEKPPTNMQYGTSVNRSSQNVFKGQLFRFSSYFPPDRRAEIVEWINQGGGTIVNDHISQNVYFTIESHGLFRRPADASQTVIVSTHWIRSCLEDGCMPDVSSNIIYSPLPCRVPLPGFESFRFCVSQYEDKERHLIRNLCFVLGAKFTEKLSGKVTHLLCKFTSGAKYEAACKWGIHAVTFEWISECIRKDSITSMDLFQPKEVTAQDQEAGLCTTTQYNTQTAKLLSGDVSSQLLTRSQALAKSTIQCVSNRDYISNEAKQPNTSTKKRLRLSNEGKQGDSKSSHIRRKVSAYKKDSLKANMPKVVHDVSHDAPDHLRDSVPPDVRGNVSVCKMDSAEASASKVVQEVSHDVPASDVATVIEDLLAQSDKIQDITSLGRTEPNENVFPPDHSVLEQKHADSRTAVEISNHWLSRNEKPDDNCNKSRLDGKGVICEGFSETQTESQVVGYEQDFSGIQMILDRVRTRSSLT